MSPTTENKEPSGYAAELYFDPAGEARVHHLWEGLAEMGLRSGLLEMDSRPHISLAIFDDLEVERLEEGLREFARTTAPLEVDLSCAGTFPSREGVVFVAPVVTAELLAMHHRFHMLLDELGVVSSEHYRPGVWIPHCTVGIYLSDAEIPVAVDLCRRRVDTYAPTMLVEVGIASYSPPMCGILSAPFEGTAP